MRINIEIKQRFGDKIYLFSLSIMNYFFLVGTFEDIRCP